MSRGPKARTWRHVHAALTVAWAAAIVPTVLYWRDSVLWVALISCYANAGTHFSAWQAARAEDAGEGGDGR